MRRPTFARAAALFAAGSLLAALPGCGPAAPVDPLCGPVSARIDDRARLQPPAPRPALFVPHAAHRFTVGGRLRDGVTAWSEIALVGKRALEPQAGPIHIETVPADARTLRAATVRFAPAVRVAGDERWTELGWVEGVRRRAGRRDVFDVPVDLAAMPADRALEVRVHAWVSPDRERHVWESAPVRLPEDGVLAAGFAVAPGGRGEGAVAFRALVCEGDACECAHAEVLDAADAALDVWQERRLSLAPWGGREVTLVLQSEALATESGAVDPGLWATPTLWRRAPANAERARNVLLVSLDTLGADHLGVYGYARDTSPFIDDVLAPRGTLFEHAAAPATTTGPSHMTLFTSLPPSTHQVVVNVGGRALADGVPTLASTLRDAGWATGAVTENGAIMVGLGFERGFEHYEENRSPQLIRPLGHIESTFEAGRHFVARHRGMPWFLWVQTYQVHHPYSPPPAYQSLFAGDGLDRPDVPRLFSGGRESFDPVHYDREIRYTDDQLRAFLTDLEQAGALEDTVVVVLGDHGEGFFEHRFLGHGSDVHRETVRVPLVLSGPGIPAGRRIDANVGLADLMPTLLEMLGVAAPAGLTGRSLVPLLRGEDDGAFADRPVFSEAWQPEGVTRRGRVAVDQPTLAVRRGDHKLIRYRDGAGFRYAFYDLAADPDEREDLLAAASPLGHERARAFDALVDLLADYAEEAERRARALDVGAAPEVEVDPERLEKLRALGYVE